MILITHGVSVIYNPDEVFAEHTRVFLSSLYGNRKTSSCIDVFAVMLTIDMSEMSWETQKLLNHRESSTSNDSDENFDHTGISEPHWPREGLPHRPPKLLVRFNNLCPDDVFAPHRSTSADCG